MKSKLTELTAAVESKKTNIKLIDKHLHTQVSWHRPISTVYLSLVMATSLTWSCSDAKFSGSNVSRGQAESVPPEQSAPPIEAPEAKSPETPVIGGGEGDTAPAPGSTEGTGSVPDPSPTPTPTPTPTPPQPPAPPPSQETPKEPKNPGLTEVPKEVPKCTPTERLTGSRMLIVIDNSNSNAETDCPGAMQIGTFNGSSTYRCAEESSRAKAAMAVFDLLKDVSAADPGNPLAKSQLALAYFPTKEDYVSGAKVERGFTEAGDVTRSEFQKSLAFTQTPFGLTPYSAAITSVEQVFQAVPEDGRSKVVLYVTDGEATDRNPSDAVAKAQALMGAGVQFYTVYYPTKDSRSERAAKHTVMMQEIDSGYFAAGGDHWYDESRFQSFQSYMNYILGQATGAGQPEPSTLFKISSKVDKDCVDGAAICARKSYEVADAPALSQALRQIVKREVIGCEL